MQPVAKSDGETNSRRGRPKKTLPKGYFSLSDVAQNIADRVVTEPDLKDIKANWAGKHWSSNDSLKQAVVAYLVEYLIWQFRAHIKPALRGHGTDKKLILHPPLWHIRLWHEGNLLEFDIEGTLHVDYECNAPTLDEILYKNNLSVLDFIGRGENPLQIRSCDDEDAFADFASTRLTGHDFIDAETWSILSEPKVDLSSFEGFVEDVGSRARAEYEMIKETWQKVLPFAGALIVIQGRSARKIAERVIPELKRFYLRKKLPLDPDNAWLKTQVLQAVSRYRELSSRERLAFTKKTFSELVTGDPADYNGRFVKEFAWPKFLAIVSDDNVLVANKFSIKQIDTLKKRGRKSLRKNNL